LVEQDDDSGKYRLGLAVVRLGGHAEKSLDLRSIAMSELESLARSIARPPPSKPSKVTAS